MSLKKFNYYCCLFLVLAISFSTTAQDCILDELDACLNDYNEVISNNPDIITTRYVPPADIVIFLVDDLNVLTLLQINLYCKTYPLNKRNILDAPIFLPHPHETKKRNFGIQLFYNQTSRMNFTEDSTCLQSYLDIFDSNTLQKLSFIPEFFPNSSIDPIRILPLFQNMTIQDRQAGCMFYGAKRYKKFYFSLTIPLLYHERNFYMTEEEQEAIIKAAGIQTTDDEYISEEHFISDRIGIGDTRIIIGFPVTKDRNLSVDVGAQITIPTELTLKEGLYARLCFNKKAPRQILDLEKVFDLASQNQADQAFDLARNFLFGALDHLAANLLDTNVGNDKHAGIGIFLLTKTPLSFFIKRPWAHNIQWRGHLVLEYLLPTNETRYFIEEDDPDDFDPSKFDSDLLVDNPDYALKQLEFIQKKLTDKFYPFAFDTMVSPGIVFRWTGFFSYDIRKWRFQAGTDWWFKGGESLSRIKKPRDFSGILLTKKAVKPFAFQSKLHGSIFYTIEKPHQIWTIALLADYTYWSSGIGQDFTLSLKAEMNF